MPPVVAFILQQEALLFQCPFFTGQGNCYSPIFMG